MWILSEYTVQFHLFTSQTVRLLQHRRPLGVGLLPNLLLERDLLHGGPCKGRKETASTEKEVRQLALAEWVPLAVGAVWMIHQRLDFKQYLDLLECTGLFVPPNRPCDKQFHIDFALAIIGRACFSRP